MFVFELSEPYRSISVSEMLTSNYFSSRIIEIHYKNSRGLFKLNLFTFFTQSKYRLQDVLSILNLSDDEEEKQRNLDLLNEYMFFRIARICAHMPLDNRKTNIKRDISCYKLLKNFGKELEK